MSPILKGFAIFAVSTVLSLPAGAQGIVTQMNITLALAQTIANAAIAQCRSMGYKISVTVVDREGLPIVMMRDDGAGVKTGGSSACSPSDGSVEPDRAGRSLIVLA